jgi:hypothetical protein
MKPTFAVRSDSGCEVATSFYCSSIILAGISNVVVWIVNADRDNPITKNTNTNDK